MKIVADQFIPFLKGRLEPYAQISYIHPDDFSPETIKGADALLIRTRTKCGAPLLEGSSVKFIATATIGMDQFDLPWCASHGIATFNSPGCNAPAVAQYVWSSLLHIGVNPRGLKLGVVGCGNVGSIVADWGRKLGAEVLVCDPPKEEAGQGRGYVSLETVARECDVITLHTPLTKIGKYSTFHLIDEYLVSLMRNGAILVNAARGPVIDTDAVAKRAQTGSIRLITDTWEGEPNALNPIILEKSEIATPHIAGYSLQGKQRATRMIIESLARHFGLPLAGKQGEPGINVLDLPEPYTPWPAVTAEDICASYDPVVDTSRLKASPQDFEYRRDRYEYRPELYL
ncbi:MAG: 4-phosphoerythronate dehydrogenase [Prevotella sp.]|nr:4-phosphoerythronate dehydrogenase [Prevotella sp.]MCM1075058.1 4-phosphoerythronate dehydrogenase [Ruminococcus sp.]